VGSGGLPDGRHPLPAPPRQVELSQLYHAPWIDGLRQIRLAALLLGHGFLWSDLVCYAVGVGVGALTESLTARHSSASHRPRTL
jgi:hypothetical protein